MGAEKSTIEHTSHIDALPDDAVKAIIVNMQHGFGRFGGGLAMVGVSAHAESDGSISFDLQSLCLNQPAIILQVLNDQIADGARVIFEKKK